ncbi:RsiV family protein [Salibacterium salarium]|nr:RsiV family protein [Salibacterium salarium]
MEHCMQPIPIQTYALPYPSICFPQLIAWNTNIINTTIFEKVMALFRNVNDLGYYQPGVTEMIGTYELKNNQRGIVSFTFTNFANMPGLAHPVEFMDSITADANTDIIYPLSDLFKPGSRYMEQINAIIEKQISDRNIPLLDGFQGIKPNQKYYLADKSIVIYFDEYDITPGYVGFPMFPISGYDLQSSVKSTSPLGMMLS